MLKDFVGIYGSRLRCLEADSWLAQQPAAELAKEKPGFDCFIVNQAEDFDGANNCIIEVVARKAGSWVEIFGNAAEQIHDTVDEASVRIGRQCAVGEGEPMTAWYEGLSAEEIASYIWTGGQGESNIKVLILVGSQTSVAELKRTLMEHQR